MILEYRESLAWLFNTQRFGIKLGLENSRRLFDARCSSPTRTDHPRRGDQWPGLVCALLDSICRAAGYRTALFTSPILSAFASEFR
jgi:dihydrofolate synthase/folylpolyglutamate synthase